MFFKILGELAFPLVVRGFSYKPKEKVHNALVEAIPTIPIAVLFYLLQYNDEKLIRKIAQDYIIQFEDSKILTAIFHNIKTLYFDNQALYYIRQNGLNFLSEIINVLQPTLWEVFFREVWINKLKEESLFSERHSDKNFFIEKAISLIQTTETASIIINDCLKATLAKNAAYETATITQYLYNLNSNESLQRLGAEIEKLINKDLIKLITESIETDIMRLFLLGNIYFILSDDQKNSIRKNLLKIKNLQSDNDRIWRIILYFADNDVSAVERIKEGILQSPRLWDAGFSEKGLSSSNDFIVLSRLIKTNDGVGIIWAEDELLAIFKRLKETLNQIVTWALKDDKFRSFGRILQEMFRFLLSEKERLSSQKDYQQTFEIVQKQLILEKGFDNYIDGLISKEKEEYVTAQNDIFYNLYRIEEVNIYEKELGIILNKVLLQSEPGLAEALGESADYFVYKKENVILRNYAQILIEILKRYQKVLPINIDQPFLEDKLICIAYTLKFWGYEIPEVEAELKLLNTSRFMGTLYNLASKLSLN